MSDMLKPPDTNPGTQSWEEWRNYVLIKLNDLTADIKEIKRVLDETRREMENEFDRIQEAVSKNKEEITK